MNEQNNIEDYNNKLQYLIDNGIRKLSALRTLRFTEKAFDDEDWRIRWEAYRRLEFTKKAFDDKDEYVRLEAYRRLATRSKRFKIW